MSRDLLFKPQMPSISNDDNANQQKASSNARFAPLPSLNRSNGRDLGATPDAISVFGGVPAGLVPQKADGKTPAHKAAYFNVDTKQVHTPNQRASNMQALRGGDGAADLKRIVLPASPMGIESPQAEHLQAATELMGCLSQQGTGGLTSLLQRQGQWAQAPHVTQEMLEARMAQLEEMIALRKQALERVRRLSEDRLSASATLLRGLLGSAASLQDPEALVAEGTQLVEETSSQAAPMHQRLMKAMGVKVR